MSSYSPPLDQQTLFFENIWKTSNCWIWLRARNSRGYGVWRSRRSYSKGHYKKAVSIQAHRWAWEIFRGPVPDGLLVCHTCDNPPCCNPDHLFLGTPKDNAQDAVKKGRLGRHRIVAVAPHTRSVSRYSHNFTESKEGTEAIINLQPLPSLS